MRQGKLEQLRYQLQQLKIITFILQIENRILQERVNCLENESAKEYNVGDRIKIFDPTSPGRNRQVVTQDSIVNVTRVTDN